VFAHVASFKAPVAQLEGAGMQGFRERVAPVLQQLPGLQGTLVLMDRAQGELLGITLWDTEEHARDASRRLVQEREAGAREMGATASEARILEVLVQSAS